MLKNVSGFKIDNQGFIVSLGKNDVFVFGSNKDGSHGAGTAAVAYENGWVRMHKDAIGPSQANENVYAYGIDTMSGPDQYETIKKQIPALENYVKNHPDKMFHITPLGTGIGNLAPEKIAEIQKPLMKYPNVRAYGIIKTIYEKMEEITELWELYSLSKKCVHDKIISFLKGTGYDVNAKIDEYIYANPQDANQHILLTAHMDTINDKNGIQEPTKEEFEINSDRHGAWIGQKNPNKVLGGDDRNGIYMIKKIIEAGYKPYIVLTHNEETGGAGVKSFLEDYPTKINNLKLAIGIDRGFHSKIKQFDPIKDKLNQVVFYNNDSQDLKNFFFNHGFSQAIGTNSDIKKIGDSYQVPYANISAAYINEHRSYERTYIDDLECILNNLKNIMEENNNLNLTFKKI